MRDIPIRACGGISGMELIECAMEHRHAQNAEDLVLLPTLLHLARHHAHVRGEQQLHRAGSFVEYAAFARTSSQPMATVNAMP